MAVLCLIFLAGVAVFVIPTLDSFRERSDQVSCMGNLREIQKLAMMFTAVSADFFPRSRGGGQNSFEVFVKSQLEMSPGLFVCPADPDHVPGKVDSDGHLGYEIVPWRPGSAGSLVAFDRAPYHKGKRNVAFLDAAVECMDEEEFQKIIEIERIRHRRGEPRGMFQR